MTDTTLARRARRHRRLGISLNLAFILPTAAAVAMIALWDAALDLDLSERDPWLLDAKLAMIRVDGDRCLATMKHSELIMASSVADRALVDGCGWHNAVRIAEAGGAKVGVGTVSCDVAAAFAMWVAHGVQPAAVAIYGKQIRSIRHLGTYSCRNIVGSRMWGDTRSQHATAAAIDIAGVTLESGHTITVKDHWRDTGRDGEFLRQILTSACRYFRVAIGPDFNEAHHDHFHLDRGYFSACR